MGKIQRLLPIFNLLAIGWCWDVNNRVKVDRGHFVDESGRVLMFRGINSVEKRSPWYDYKMLDPKRHQDLEDWGFNAVRLGMMWSGFEPAEGEVNETYSGIVAEIVSGLAEHGIYTYLDMHQDVLKEPGYYGVPKWIIDKLEPSAHPYPWPLKDESGYTTWACGYFTEEMSNNFDQIYRNVAGTADSFANFWREVALRYKDRKHILGYELMNEPWTGDIYLDASLILPGNAGQQLLEPFFNRASDAIRSVDNSTIVFWEPVTYAYFVYTQPSIIVDGILDAYLKTHNISIFYPAIKQVCGDLQDDAIADPQLLQIFENLGDLASEALLHRFNHVGFSSGNPSILGPGFSAPPGGPEYLDRTVMSWHYYCWAISDPSDGEYDPVLRAVCDDLLGPMVFDTVGKRAEELGGSATFLTEFGTCYPNSTSEDILGTIECNFVLDQADAHLQSWSYWDTAGGGVFWDSEGNTVEEVVRVFSRPYPPATAGRPISIQFNHVERYFQYKYTPDLTISLPTEIFVPPLVYPNSGYDVVVSSGLEWELDQESRNRILVRAVEAVEEATVTITPK